VHGGNLVLFIEGSTDTGSLFILARLILIMPRVITDAPVFRVWRINFVEISMDPAANNIHSPL
jgi:hypothetical protein